MKNKILLSTIIACLVFLALTIGISVIKEYDNKKLLGEGTITKDTTNTNGTSRISPKTSEEVTEGIPEEGETEPNPNGEENPQVPQDENNSGSPEEPTTGSSQNPNQNPNTSTTTTKKPTTTKKTTTTTTAKPIPATISCSNRQIITMSRAEILSKIGHPYNSNTCLKWDGFINGSKDTFDGTIPTEWLGDSIYLSMAQPAEVRSQYMIGANRDNAHTYGVTEDKLRLKQVAIGAIYMTKGASLPSTYTINFGKIKLFGYSKSKKKWVTIDSQPHPKMVMQYQLPWTEHLPTVDFTNKFVDHGSYISITFNSGEIDDTHLMHFWGQLTDYDKTDYLYYASAFEVWTPTQSAVGGLTATSGIDTKDKSGGDALQLYSSYGMKVDTYKKVLWGHTIPMNDYDYYRDSIQLQNLFNSN